MTDIFEHLESNNKEVVESAKQSLREQFIKTNEPWLLCGIYEYYLTTNSERAMEILVNIKEPHYVYLFDRISDSIKGSKTEIKVKSLTMLGYIARSQPTWLYRLQDHNLLRDMLNLLKSEVELLPLISALLVLIVLLPMIPATMGSHLKDIFDIFSRLASWNCNPGKMVEDQLIHMQVALYALFLRLYGMYPCNFLGYLRNQYKDKHKPVFVHTIKPMLDTVRMHPSLVTASKDTEITTERWRKIGVHDVIVECERFSLDLTDRCPHDSCQYTTGFRSRSGTSNSTIEPPYQLQNLKSLASLPNPTSENAPFFTPSSMFHVQTPPITESVPTNIQGIARHFITQEGTSPPEAAIEATPETTPVRDYRALPARAQPLNSNIARALTSFNNKNRPSASLTTTPTHSQPSSPMRKEHSPFNYPETRTVSAFVNTRPESGYKQKLNKLIMDRSQVAEPSTSTATEISKGKNLPPPSSPLRIINPETASRQFSTNQRIESPITQEDEEVLSIVSKTNSTKATGGDFFLQDFDEVSDKVEEEIEQGSPCTAGGLHMPNSKSMNNFAKRVQRLRHHSQCNPEPERMEISTGSSPGNCAPFSNSATVRRAVSCPEMKKSPTTSTKDKKTKPLDEADEEAASEKKENVSLNSSNGVDESAVKQNLGSKSCTTQTDNFWPYEHLFLGVFPSLEANNVKPSPVPSPSPFNSCQDKEFLPSVYDILDRYIDIAVRSNDKNVTQIREQLQLLHQQLLFERHRRETHAYRNRRLLSDAKSTRLLEECNSALRDTVQLQEKDLDALRKQLENFKKARFEEEKKLNKTIQYWENQCKLLQVECKNSKDANDSLEKELKDVKNKCAILDVELRQAQDDLLDAMAEVNVARQQAQAGERGRKELEQVHKELLLIGELQLKYKERFDSLDANREIEEELVQLKESYREELKVMNQHLENTMGALEAYRSRVLDLEHTIVAKDDLILSQKQILSAINEQRFEKLEAVESKYQTQLKINRVLEEQILDLRQRLEMEKGRRSVNSPDTSSCHEVNVTTTAGFSPHSSPLSASLASSEGSTAFHEREVKNLQAIVDQKDSTSRFRMDDSGDVISDEGQQTFSTKTD